MCHLHEASSLAADSEPQQCQAIHESVPLWSTRGQFKSGAGDHDLGAVSAYLILP